MNVVGIRLKTTCTCYKTHFRVVENILAPPVIFFIYYYETTYCNKTCIVWIQCLVVWFGWVKCVVIVPNVLPSHCGERVGPGGNGFVKFVELFSRSSRFFGYFDCKSTLISSNIGNFLIHRCCLRTTLQGVSHLISLHTPATLQHNPDNLKNQPPSPHTTFFFSERETW